MTPAGRCPICGRVTWRPPQQLQCATLCYRESARVPAAYWTLLMAPSSPLVKQPDELRQALIDDDGPAVYLRLREVADDRMPSEVFRLVDGLALYLLHLAAKQAGDHKAARVTALRARDQHDVRTLDDLRQLGTLVRGLAAGELRGRLYVEVRQFLGEVCTPDTAKALLDRIRRRRLLSCSTRPHR